MPNPRNPLFPAWPVLMPWFLREVTGVPTTGEHAIASRGDARRHCLCTVNAFIPWPPRSGPEVRT